MNWIINNYISLNKDLANSFGFDIGDKVVMLVSKEDECFYISKFRDGDGKLHRGDNKTIKTKNKVLCEKLKLDESKRVYFDAFQDEQDRKHNAIKCVIRNE